MKQQSGLHFVFLFLLWVMIQGVLFWRFGIREMYDATYYIIEADNLVKSGSLSDPTYLFYLIPISILALCRWFMGVVNICAVRIWLAKYRIWCGKNVYPHNDYCKLWFNCYIDC